MHVKLKAGVRELWDKSSDTLWINVASNFSGPFSRIRLTSAYKTSGTSGCSLSQASAAWGDQQYSYSPWVGCKSIAGLPRTLNSLVLIYWAIFFVKKYLLVGVSSMLWTGQWISQWVSESDRIYYKQPIKFLVLKVNGIIQFRTAIFIPLWKRRKYLFRYFLWVRLRILVMDEMSLEVWNSAWASCMQMDLDIFIFS